MDRNVGNVSFTVNREMSESDALKKGAARGTSYALLIGTDNYREFSNLSNPVFDITTIGRELEQTYGFTVNTLIDPSQEQFYSMLRS
ncbi:MAG: caspase family protein [Cytophagales bacterium]|nr:caspase family protein [Cytophagales bacterium]